MNILSPMQKYIVANKEKKKNEIKKQTQTNSNAKNCT